MKKNVGKLDRIFRLVIAIIFAILGSIYSSWFYILTIILLLTAMIGVCPPYAMLGINTCGGYKK